MTREILFRGKRVDNGEWAEGDLLTKYIHHEGFYTIVQNGCIYFKVIPETVGQLHNGLTKKVGQNIFKGDIIQFRLAEGPKDSVGYFEPQSDLKRETVKTIEDHYFFYIDVKLVGNIHDK